MKVTSRLFDIDDLKVPAIVPSEQPTVERLVVSMRHMAKRGLPGGLENPIGVEPDGSVVYGRRRSHAAVWLRREDPVMFTEVPARVYEIDQPGDRLLLQDLENYERSDSSPIEKAAALGRLVYQEAKHEEETATPRAGGHGGKGPVARVQELTGADKAAIKKGRKVVRNCTPDEIEALAAVPHTTRQANEYASLPSPLARQKYLADLKIAAEAKHDQAVARKKGRPKGRDTAPDAVTETQVAPDPVRDLEAALTVMLLGAESIQKGWRDARTIGKERMNGRFAAVMEALAGVDSFVHRHLDPFVGNLRDAIPAALLAAKPAEAAHVEHQGA